MIYHNINNYYSKDYLLLSSYYVPGTLKLAHDCSSFNPPNQPFEVGAIIIHTL